MSATEGESAIYAYRVPPNCQWHGRPDALPDGQYQTGAFGVNPLGNNPHACRLEVRYGVVPGIWSLPEMYGYVIATSDHDGSLILVQLTDAMRKELSRDPGMW